MQRLLADAEKFSGVHYDLGNLADMYSAIHVIQQQLDIAGSTAEEASATLSGSFAAMKAAAENVLGSLSAGADLSVPLQALSETAWTYFSGNLLPMLGNLMTGIPQMLYDLVPQILQAGTQLIGSLAAGFAQGIPEFLSTALPQLLNFTEDLRANAGAFVDAGLNMITQLLNGLITGLPQLIAYVPDMIIDLCGIINDNMPKVLLQGVAIVLQLVVGIAKAVPALLANWKKILQAVLSAISAVNWLSIGKNILTGVANGVKSMGSQMLKAFKGGFSSALNWLKSLPSQAVQWGKTLWQNFINGLTGKENLAKNIATAATAGFTVAETASGSKPSFGDWIDSNTELAESAQNVADIAVPAYTKSGDAAAAAASKTATAASVVSSYADTVTEVLGKVTRTTQTTNEVLSDGQKQHKRVITETSRQLVNGVLKDIKTVTAIGADGQKTIQQTMENVRELASTVTATNETLVDGIRTSTQTVTETLTDGTENQKRTITKSYTAIVEGALRTVKEVQTIAADGTTQVATTIENASSSSFAGLMQGWKAEADKGVLGTFGALSAAIKKKDWASIGQWVLSTLYNGLAPNAQKFVDDFGITLIQQLNALLGDKFSVIAQKAWDLGSDIAGAIAQGLRDALQEKGLAQLLEDAFSGALGAAGTAIGTFVTNAGGAISSLAGKLGGLGALTEGIGSALSQAGALIMANPEIAAVLAIAAGVTALGAALFSKFSRGKQNQTEQQNKNTVTYKDIQDAYWYGSMRSMAGYDFRTDGRAYPSSPAGSQLTAYQQKMQASVEALYGVVQQYLPQAGNLAIKLDDGTLVGALAPSMDAQLGHLAALAERGN